MLDTDSNTKTQAEYRSQSRILFIDPCLTTVFEQGARGPLRTAVVRTALIVTN